LRTGSAGIQATCRPPVSADEEFIFRPVEGPYHVVGFGNLTALLTCGHACKINSRLSAWDCHRV